MIETTEVVLQSEEDANKVLDAMKSLLNQYEQVTLADFLDLVGIPNTFNDNNVGWTNLAGVEARSVPNGFESCQSPDPRKKNMVPSEKRTRKSC